MQTLNMSINMPKPDLQVFRGNPGIYYSFINNFEARVATKLTDDRQKLTYLLQVCGGDAKDSIACCVLMDPRLGYHRAKEILAQQFGQPHVVAHSLIDKVVNRPAIKPNDYKVLAELARQIRRCEVTLSHSGYTADLDSTDTLLKIQQL
ncbi:hypothetical protein HOLleu_25240 [Holothuria leucospilota]|uniref:Uncharacterized protein n=1 Tax=Holothuria leucospilota TaxID=206669 RepID=A0A9Q1H3V3_HOLLE|nr:hypothetical protein HOLleu_25240 [Holothuria leucospilota]